MAKRKAEEVEAGSSDIPSKVAKLTQEDSPRDSFDSADDVNATTTINTAANGVAATNSEGSPGQTTPNSPQDPSNDSNALTTAEATDAEPAAPKTKGKKRATPVNSNEAKPKTTRKSTRSKKSPPPPEPPTVRKRINKLLKSKIQSTLNFIDTTPPRDPQRSTITITKYHLIAALMTLRQDYEISNPQSADIRLDVGEAVIKEFSASIGTFKFKTEWVVLDLNVKTEIEKMIEVKVEGWGLEDVRLLEVEIEIVGKQMEEEASLRFLESVEVVKEEKWLGVCPVPGFEVL